MEVTKSFESTEARFGAAGPLLLALYRGSASAAMLNELDRTQQSLLERFPRISTLTVIGQAASILKGNEQVRSRSVELSKKYEKQVLGSAIIVITKGLGAVMVRTFLSGFFLLSKAETPMKTFSTIAEGLSWVQALPGQDVGVKTGVTVADIERFIA